MEVARWLVMGIPSPDWADKHVLVDLVVTGPPGATDEDLAAIEAAAQREDIELVRLDKNDERYSSIPLGADELAQLAIVLKALILRAGGELEVSLDELEHAASLLVVTEGDDKTMRMRIVEGEPPPVPVFAAQP